MVVDMTGSRTRFVHRPLPQNDPRQRRPNISRAQDYYHGSLLVILTTDFGLSLRGVITTKPAGHVVRARSSSTVFSETPVSGWALTFMLLGKPASAR